MSDTPAEIERALARLAQAFDGTVAVAARDERTGETLTHDPDRVMWTASVIKLAVLATVYVRADRGELSLDERLAATAAQRVEGSGVLDELSEGLAPTVRDHATLMVVLSDNTATNVLIDLVGGVDAVNALLGDELGLADTVLRRRLDFSDPQRGPLGLATPRELVALVRAIVTDGRLVSPSASAEMRAILARQHYLDQVPRTLRHEPLDAQLGRDQPLTVANKTGMIDAIRADAGVLGLAGTDVTYAVMSESAHDASAALDSDAQLVNAEVGRLLVRRYWPGPGPPPLHEHPLARWTRLARAADPDAGSG